MWVKVLKSRATGLDCWWCGRWDLSEVSWSGINPEQGLDFEMEILNKAQTRGQRWDVGGLQILSLKKWSSILLRGGVMRLAVQAKTLWGTFVMNSGVGVNALVLTINLEALRCYCVFNTNDSCSVSFFSISVKAPDRTWVLHGGIVSRHLGRGVLAAFGKAEILLSGQASVDHRWRSVCVAVMQLHWK